LSVFDLNRGFVGEAPGQDIDLVLRRLTIRDLQILVGARVLPLLPSDSRDNRSMLEAAAARILQDRATELFASSEIRKTFLRNLDHGKIEELRQRLRGCSIDPGDSKADIESLDQPRVWKIAAGFFGLDAAETATAPAVPLFEQLQPTFPLFEYQRSVVRRAYAIVGGGYGRTLIHMPTGAGKTRTAMHLVSRILNENEPGVVVWLAVSRELLDQAAETFENAWPALGNRSLTLQRFWGKTAREPEVEDGLLIAGLSKLHAWSQRRPAEFMAFCTRVRLVIMDEAHQAIAPTYSTLIDQLSGLGRYNSLIGLTATPGRTWSDVQEDQLLSDYFDSSKVVLQAGSDPNPVKYLLDEGYLARPTFLQIEYSPEVVPTKSELRKLAGGDDFPEASLDRLATDTARNLAIISSVEQLLSRGHRRIIVFAISVRHAEDLAGGLTARGVFSAVVSGEMPLTKREATLRTFKSRQPDRMVICNFGVLTTGFDAPQTSAAVIARPTKSLVLYSQMVGRATRGKRAGGNATCEIMTVHDPAYPGFGDIAEAFFNWEDVWNEH
jgi:DNA repair protein RadD